MAPGRRPVVHLHSTGREFLSYDEYGGQQFGGLSRARKDEIVVLQAVARLAFSGFNQIADELTRRFHVPVVKAVSKKATGAAELKDLRKLSRTRSRLVRRAQVNTRASVPCPGQPEASDQQGTSDEAREHRPDRTANREKKPT
jgi:hypothetical protein